MIDFELLNIMTNKRTFLLLKIYASKDFVAAHFCCHTRRMFEAYTCLFSIEAGRFIDMHSRAGVRIKILNYEKTWFKKAR